MQGEYFLRGVMETASGFKINPDSTFEFFFSYGALDRFGTGTWKAENGTIIFNSRSRPPKDFALLKSEKRAGNQLVIRIIDNNEFIVRYVDAVLKNGSKIVEESTNQKGIIQVANQPLDSIGLIFRLCPDRFSTFPVPSRDHNYFEFKFEPWIAEVFFDDFELKVEDDGLSGKHPLLNGNAFKYTR